MKSFEPGVLERQVFPAAVLGTVRTLGEYRCLLAPGSRVRQTRALDHLRDDAFLASVESAARLDGSAISPGRLREIARGQAEPGNRAEGEIAGYRDALSSVTREPTGDDFTPQTVLGLHERLRCFTPEGGGIWKASDDLVTEARPDGSIAVIFTPVPAYAVDDAMIRLHDGLSRHWAGGTVDPLLLIPAYVLDFLCIHPFAEGTDAMARLLTLLLLRRAGYHVGGFAAFDELFEQSRSACAAALQASWRGWHDAAHTIAPWSGWLLGVVLEAYRRIDHAMDAAAPRRGAKRDRVADAIDRLPLEFRYTDLERLVPSVSRPTINRALRRLRADRVVRCVRPGRNARWVRLS